MTVAWPQGLPTQRNAQPFDCRPTTSRPLQTAPEDCRKRASAVRPADDRTRTCAIRLSDEWSTAACGTCCIRNLTTRPFSCTCGTCFSSWGAQDHFQMGLAPPRPPSSQVRRRKIFALRPVLPLELLRYRAPMMSDGHRARQEPPDSSTSMLTSLFCSTASTSHRYARSRRSGIHH